MKCTLHTVLTLTALLVLTGCATTYYNSERGSYRLKRHLNAWQTTVAEPIAEVHDAALKGLDDLNLNPITNRADSMTAMIDGNLADGSDFEINLEAISSAVTQISVRSGLHGDRARSLRLFKAIEKHF